MNRSATVRTENAEIAYDVGGQVPLSLLIVGGNGFQLTLDVVGADRIIYSVDIRT
jgi:hypothetical protein